MWKSCQKCIISHLQYFNMVEDMKCPVFSSIGNGGTSAFLDGANSLPIVLFKKWGKSLGIKMEFFETALDLD